MGGACGREIDIGIWWGNMEERDHLENLNIEGRITLKFVLKKEMRWEGVEWINLAEDREKWRSLVNLRVL